MQVASLRSKLESIYPNLRYYSDRTRITFQLPGRRGDDMVKGSLDYEIAFQPPNRIKIALGPSRGSITRSEAVHLISDGNRVVDYRPERSEYADYPAPKDRNALLELIGSLLPRHGGRHWLGLAFLFVYDEVMNALFHSELQVQCRGSELVGGRSVEKILSLEQGGTVTGNMNSTRPISFSLSRDSTL